MSRQRVSFVERTFEKWLLGLGAAGALMVGGHYLVGMPNHVRYGDRTAGPRDLDALILADARALHRRMQSARPTAYLVPDYAGQVRRSQESSDPGRLKRSAAFGWTIPRMAVSLEADSAVTLVTPLAPGQPVIRTGIHTDTARDGGDSPPTDLVWATVAAYFDLQRYREALSQAGYALHRRKVYVVGVDLQRQNVSPSGEGGDWHDVRPAEGLSVKTGLPLPVFDDDSQRCLNRVALATALTWVKAHQAEIMQPAFLERVVAAGGWRMPALDGYRQREEAIVESLEADLRQARRSLGRREFSEAEALVVRTRDHVLATAEISQKANRLLKVIGRRIAKRRSREPAGRSPGRKRDLPIINDGDLRTQPAPRGEDKARPPADQFIVAPDSFVRHPDDGRPAVWFHDASAKHGARYRYRLRVRLWNRYAGLTKPLIDPAQAEQVELVGEWSPASEIVETP